MLEVIFSTVNLPLTILVIITVLYWIISMIGGLDLDVDFDVDVDIDAEFDTGAGIEGTSFEDTTNVEVNKEDVVGKRRKPLKWWQIFLIYFNFVGLPFMFTFTAVVLLWWLCSLIFTSFFNAHNLQFGFVIMFICLVPGLILAKLVTTPFKSFFKKLNRKGDVPVDFIGRQGISLSSISGEKMGNAEIVIEGNPYSLYIKSETGEPISYRDSILIIREAPDRSYYLAQLYKN